MIKAEPAIALHQKALQRAVMQLENQDFAARLADYAGRPIARAMRLMPRAASDRINKDVETAILNALKIAIRSIEPRSNRPPARRTALLLAGISRRQRLCRHCRAADRTAGDHNADAARHRRYRAPSWRGFVDAGGAAGLCRGVRARRAAG